MDQEKISVIIPVYNAIHYLEEAVHSVLRQNYANIEIILVNDGSTDGSGVLCNSLEQMDKRIKVLHIKNSGPAFARNVGLNIAQGKYVYFMDSDDFLESNLFNTIIPILGQGYDMVVFNYQKIDNENRILLQSNFAKGSFNFSNIEQKVEFILKKVFSYQIGWEPWNRIFVREIIEKYHIRFANENYAEDLYFFLCYLGCINNLFSLEGIFYNYKIHENSLMSLSKSQQSENLNKVNNLSCELKKFYESTSVCCELKKYYPIIHYNFLKQHIDALYNINWKQKEVFEFIQKEMDHSDTCIQLFEQFSDNIKYYLSVMDKYTLLKNKYIMEYYCHGKMVKFRIKQNILRLRVKLKLLR